MTALALGTVQFGLSYGIANAGGKVEADEVARILLRAGGAGIDMLDTAAGYGDSETVLGAHGISGWKVVTKLSEAPADDANISAWVEDQVTRSLSRLRVERLYGLLLHRPRQLLDANGEELWRSLEMERSRGRVMNIGYSIYDPAELDAIHAVYKADIVQAPLNVLDRRLVESGWLDRLAEEDVEVHTRSAFLQGLLLMEPGTRPAWTRAHSAILQAFDDWAIAAAGSRNAACLAWCLSISKVSRVVIGVQDMAQLDAAILASGLSIDPLPVWPCLLTSDLLDPRRWPRT